jgi:hypothetical protein
MFYLIEFDGVLWRRFNFTVSVLGFTLEIYCGRVFDDPLHVHLDELVERVQLLPDQTCKCFVF